MVDRLGTESHPRQYAPVVLIHTTAVRYVTPLREGGSLPAVMEADDLGTYVVKFRGAGQGRKVLVAEVICAELARALGLPIPDLVTVDVDPVLAMAEPDQEVQELLRASAGLNLGMDYLPGALDLDAACAPGAGPVDSELAGRILWFDALVGNVDRSWRNPNLLCWHGRPYLIDHGAALTFHHHWPGAAASADRAYDVRDHVMLRYVPDVTAADAALAPLVTTAVLRKAVDQVPAEWLDGEEGFDSADQLRQAYLDRLLARIEARKVWLPRLVADVAEQLAGRGQTRQSQGAPAWLTGGSRKADPR